MKKIFLSIVALATAAFSFTSCEDVPAPYNIPGIGGGSSDESSLPFSSLGLNDFSIHSITTDNPWSQGSSYTQATGYQTWDGSTNKSNKEVEGYLISPSINTTVASGKAYLSFDNSIRYANNVTGWANYHKIYISSDYDGSNFDKATWTQISWTPTASAYSDWTLYTSGKIAIPDAFVNQKNVYIAFYFKAPASASTTWELKNFYVAEGEGDGGSSSDVTAKEVTCAEAQAIGLALEDNASTTETYSVTGYITSVVGSVSNNQQTFWMADAKGSDKVLEAYWANLPAGKTAFAEGSKVKITGNIMRYGSTAEIKNATVTIIEDGGSSGSTVAAKGTGTQADPYNVAGVVAYINTLAADVTSDKEVYVKGKVLVNSTTAATITSFGNMTFTMVDEGGSEEIKFTCFQVYGPDKQKFTSVDQIKAGQTVVVCGKVVNYKGNTPETVSKGAAYVVSIDGEGSSEGGDTPAASGVSIDGTTVTLNSGLTAGSSSVSIDLNTLGYTATTEVSTLTLSDGSTITFDKGSNTNAPKFYTATKGVRLYAGSTITFNGKSNIAKIVMTCDSYSGIDYVGQTTATVTFNGKSAVYTNGGTGTTQLRVQTITIYYANGSSAKAYSFRR